jgi:drug/metabolite transporter (DMT)-like permease
VTRRDLIWLTAILVVLGAGWGLTVPLSKIAVSTGHGYFGLIFWQTAIGAVLMAVILAMRGSRLPVNRRSLLVWTVIALIGTVIPNSASYKAISVLPSGIISILLSLIPMLAFPIAMTLGLERFSLRRFVGLGFGLTGVLLLVVPKASLPEAAMLAWIPLAMVSSFCYAFEGNYVARWGTAGMDAIQVLCGASLVGAVLTLPLALGTDQFINPTLAWHAPEWALVLASVIHVFVYAAYVWLVGRAGAVFAVQVSYLVTGFGVFWAILLLNESYSPYIWAALVLISFGVFLVQPRRQEPLAQDAAIGETPRQAD